MKNIFFKKSYIEKKLLRKKFSMFVLKERYRKLKRNENKLIINYFLKKNNIQKSKLGNNWIYSYSLKKFYNTTKKLFKKNNNAWLGKLNE